MRRHRTAAIVPRHGFPSSSHIFGDRIPKLENPDSWTFDQLLRDRPGITSGQNDPFFTVGGHFALGEESAFVAGKIGEFFG